MVGNGPCVRIGTCVAGLVVAGLVVAALVVAAIVVAAGVPTDSKAQSLGEAGFLCAMTTAGSSLAAVAPVSRPIWVPA